MFSESHSSVHRIGLALIGVAIALLAFFPDSTFAQSSQTAPGGFIEKATSNVIRPIWTASQIQAFLPSRGKFTFPAPYNTDGIRLTNDGDCAGTGYADCVFSVGYSYWRNINNHVGSDTMYIFLGLKGAGPTLFSYNKVTEQVTKLGPLFAPSDPLTAHSGEGWYFSATQPTKIYVSNSGPDLRRYDVLAKTWETVFDVRAQYGTDKYIFQTHSSDDDKVHSFTLRQTGTWATLGCAVYNEPLRQFSYYPAIGAFDECQIDKSGRWVIIKQNEDGLYGEDNRIIDLQTGTQTLLLDQNGASGHSDNGYGYIVGDDNYYPSSLPGILRVWRFDLPGVPGSLPIYNTLSWGAGGIGHIAHANAKPGVPLEQQYACGGGSTTVAAPRANEIVCFRLDSSLDVLVVTQNMTDLNASGGGDSYAKDPKGNIDVTGQYFIWASNMGGSRNDVFMAKIPAQVLMGGADTAPPTAAITAPLLGAILSGTTTVSADASDNVGVAGVQFQLDGVPLGAEDTTNAYSVTWNTATVSNGLHTLTAVARDAAGNTATATALTVTVSNLLDTTPPGISSVAASLITTSGATITWTTNEAGDSQVEYGPTTSYGNSTTVNTSLVTAHSQTLNGLAAGTLYHYRVKSRDAAGNLAVSGDFTFTTASGGATPGLAGHWKFDEGSGSAITDSSGNGNAGTRVNGPIWTTGKFSWALSFDGINDYVNIPHKSIQNAYPLTVAAWIKTSNTAGVKGIVNKYYPSSQNGYQVFMSGGNLCAWYFKDSANFVWDGSGCTLMTPGYNDNQWHQVVLVVDAAGGRLYVDGVQKASQGWTGTPGAATTAQNLRVGRYNGVANSNFPGVVDDVRIYNYALSQTEVFSLFDTTPPAISSVASSNVSSSGSTITWTTNEVSDSQVEYGPSASYGSSTALDTNRVLSHSQAVGGLAAGTLYHYRVKSRDAAGNLTVSGDFTFTTTAATLSPGFVGHWKFDESSGITAEDASGNGHTGTLANGPVWTTGRLNGALSFDGVNDYVDVPHTTALNSYPLTVAAWVKTGATGLHGIVNKYYPGSMNGYQVFMSGGNLCAWYFKDSANFVWDGSGCTLMTPGYNDNQWHQVVLVVDATGGKLYVDGVQKASQGWTGTPGKATTTQALSVASYPGTASPHLAGMVDDVRVYNYALGTTEITSLYNAATAPTVQNVVWTSLVNATATGNTLQQSGCDGCLGGAVSSQTITTGDGYVEFTAPEVTTTRGAGLSNGDTNTDLADIDFAVHLWSNGNAEIRENGTYQWGTTYVSGDVFRIAVVGTQVQYSKNGTAFYMSSKAPTYPLLLDTSLWNVSATIGNAVILGR